MTHRVHNIAQFGWYETGLSLGERKQRGHFSTPLALVDQILDACGYAATADLHHLRVLDPACGSGNFLARAAQRLCLSGQAQKRHGRQLHTLLQHNIWGLDPDPVACCLAEMQIRAAINATCETRQTSYTLHIHQADSLALPWQPCVDLLLVNPPYLAAKNTDLSKYLQARQRGQVDSYLLFLDMALQAVRPGGWLGLVLPDPVLARANAAPERTRLLSECTLHHIWHIANVFTAEVGAAVIIGQKIPPSAVHQIAWTRTRWRVRPVPQSIQHTQPRQTVHQALLARQPGAELRYLLSSEQGQISERLRHALDQPSKPRSLFPLEDLVDIKRGEELGRESGALKPFAELVDGHRMLRGGVDLCPYAQPETVWGIARRAIKKPIERYLGPKLLVVKSSKNLQAVLDMRGHVVLQTLYILHVHGQEEKTGRVQDLASTLPEPDSPLDTYYFLLALLNSRLLREYVVHLHTAYKLVQPQIEQGVLARLPVAWGEPEGRQKIATRARALEQACSNTRAVVEWGQHLTFLYEEQEHAIRGLYAAAVPEIFC
ncbi:MAG: N-6 DNA methylase [Ktedonobacteraceae bacterium]